MKYYRSSQTIITSPWERAQVDADLKERAKARFLYRLYRRKRSAKDQEKYDAAVEFNRIHGLGHKPTETEKYLRKTRTTGRKVPITLAKHA